MKLPLGAVSLAPTQPFFPHQKHPLFLKRLSPLLGARQLFPTDTVRPQCSCTWLEADPETHWEALTEAALSKRDLGTLGICILCQCSCPSQVSTPPPPRNKAPFCRAFPQDIDFTDTSVSWLQQFLRSRQETAGCWHSPAPGCTMSKVN